MITFHPATQQFGIAYKEPGFQRWMGGFLDQDGNRIGAPITVVNVNPYDPGLRDVLPFPFSNALLATFEVYGHPDSFGNNVFIGDAAGVGYASNANSGIVNYTNNGGDKFVANNCGEHEEMGASTVDKPRNLFLTSYTQNFHQYDNGFCKAVGGALMAGYHSNQLPFNGFIGPFLIENGAGAQDAVYNPGTTHVWLGYAPAQQGRLRVARMTPAGVAQFIDLTGADGQVRFGLKLAVQPVTNNVLALWQVRDANFNITLVARLYNQNGVALTPEVIVGNAITDGMNAQRAWVEATADNFLVAAYMIKSTPQGADTHVFGRVLSPAVEVRSPWTQIDHATDIFGNQLRVNFGVDLVANPARGTYGVVFDTTSDIYFVEVTAAAGIPLTVSVDGTGTGSVTSSPAGINCPGTCSMPVAQGTTVDLTPSAGNFSDFTGWGGDCSGTGACSVTVNAPANVSATFTKQRFPITVTKVGQGLIRSNPQPIDCGATCSADFDADSYVQLHAYPDIGWRFDGFTGPCGNYIDFCMVHVTSAALVTATFVKQYTLTFELAGNGGLGAWSTNVPFLNDFGFFTAQVDVGATASINVSPDAETRFAGWSGGCSGTGECQVLITGDVTVTATLIRQFEVQVSISGGGGSSVTSSPAGIACPGDCSERYDTGTSVTLTAPAISGYRFAGWSGDPGCTGMTCVIGSPVLYKLAAVTATFVEQTALNVSIAGTGGGSVIGPGITCPADCSEQYDINTPVTLNAQPNASSDFAGWSGACSGTGACVVTMSAAQSVVATFTARQFTLSVSLAGAGGGVVASNPAGINCGPSCAADFDAGALVSLAASPDGTSTFAGWSGACSGTGACIVPMNAAQSVTATFDAVSIASVSAAVSALAPAIGSGPVNSVNGKLSNAQASLTRDNKNAAANQINAAINEIQALVRSGRLDVATGAALTAQLQAILIGL